MLIVQLKPLDFDAMCYVFKNVFSLIDVDILLCLKI